MKKLVLMALAAVAATSSAWAVNGAIKTATGVKKGDITWSGASKTYTVKQGKASVAVPLADVEDIRVEKPAGFDQAVKSRNVAMLKKIIKDYRMLEWDKPAGSALVDAYLNGTTKNPQAAYDAAQDIIRDDKTAAYKGDLAPAYWQALFRLGKTQQLENCLKKAASDGDRTSSANALIMRGDMICAADTPASHRQALVDAYLRVALMYVDPECAQSRADAMLRAANSFSKLGMASREQDFKAMAQQVQASVRR